METVLNFMTKLTDVVKNHVKETKDCIGKDIVDASASVNGICVDKIKTYFGVKFSMLGQKYDNADSKQIETSNEDILVCQGNNGKKVFIPMSDIIAIGSSIILTKSNLGQIESRSLNGRKEEVYRRYFTTKESLKEILPKVEETKSRRHKRKSVLALLH